MPNYTRKDFNRLLLCIGKQTKNLLTTQIMSNGVCSEKSPTQLCIHILNLRSLMNINMHKQYIIERTQNISSALSGLNNNISKIILWRTKIGVLYTLLRCMDKEHCKKKNVNHEIKRREEELHWIQKLYMHKFSKIFIQIKKTTQNDSR